LSAKPDCFQFLGIPPKGEQVEYEDANLQVVGFPISRDPPEGGTKMNITLFGPWMQHKFPISRDPPEGGTPTLQIGIPAASAMFPISRDPPEGGTGIDAIAPLDPKTVSNF